MRLITKPYNIYAEKARIAYHINQFTSGNYSKANYLSISNYHLFYDQLTHSDQELLCLFPDSLSISKVPNKTGFSTPSFNNTSDYSWIKIDETEILSMINTYDFYSEQSSQLILPKLEKLQKSFDSIQIVPTLSGMFSSFSTLGKTLIILISLPQISKAIKQIIEFQNKPQKVSHNKSPKEITINEKSTITNISPFNQILNSLICHHIIQKNIHNTLESLKMPGEFLYIQNSITAKIIDNFKFSEYFPDWHKIQKKYYQDFTVSKSELLKNDYLNIRKLTPNELRLENNQLTYKGEIIEKHFSSEENNLIKALVQNQGEITDYSELSNSIWGNSAIAKFSLWAIQKLVQNIRQKFILLDIPPDTIKSSRGRGYILG